MTNWMLGGFEVCFVEERFARNGKGQTAKEVQEKEIRLGGGGWLYQL
jgi:hypothetical protein